MLKIVVNWLNFVFQSYNLFNNHNFYFLAITSGTVTWYGVPTNLGALSLISDIVTTTGIVFLLPVANIVQVTYENNVLLGHLSQ